MRFWRRTRQTQVSARGFAETKGQPLLEASAKALEPLVEEFAEEADTLEALADADRAIDLLFAFTVILRGAGADGWQRFAMFTINQAIPRRDDQAAALLDIQLFASAQLRARQAKAANWARSDLTAYVETLPDEWFVFQLPDGRRTNASGVKENCVEQLAFAVLALTGFDDADEDNLRTLYVPVQVLVPIEDVLALAASPGRAANQ